MEINCNEPERTSSVPGRRSDGIDEPSCEVTERDGITSQADGTGQEDDELTWYRKHVKETGEPGTAVPAGAELPEKKPVILVTRKTGLRSLTLQPRSTVGKTGRKTCPCGKENSRCDEVLWMITELQLRIDDLDAEIGEMKAGRGSP